MDLAQLTADLDALRERARCAASRRAGHGGARRPRGRVPGQEGRAHRDPARHRRAAGRGPAAVGAVANQVREPRSRRPSASAGTELGGSELEARLARRGRRRHDARPADPPRLAAPDRRDGREIARRLRPVRVRRLRGPRDRGRPDQLPDAQHPAGPPGAGPVGHALPRRRRAACCAPTRRPARSG